MSNANIAKQRAELLAKEILELEQKWLRDEKIMLRDIAVELLQKSAALAEMIVDSYPPLATKNGGQVFQIPPHDQAPNPELPSYICPKCYQSTRERDGTCLLCDTPTLSAEVQAVNEILEGEDNGES